jgi:[glutamine synthetase] adenylyltransferase / [glutamine synthetase]-adenylyl-L-tyrosine phosphorylase
MQLDFPQAPFHDPHKAEENWLRLETRLASALNSPLASLLAQSPDPDGALNLLERYAQAAPAEVLRELARWPGALTYLVAAFSFGSLLAEPFLAEPALALQFARDRRFATLSSREDILQDYARFSTTHPAFGLAEQLARFKRRNSVRIALKDVLGLATLAETTLELSLLADVILGQALADADQELEKRYGQPQYRDAQGRIARSGFSILSLGKLGGSELNYSSDIDLLFLYAHDGETAGGREAGSAIPNKEYFVRLAQAVTGRLAEATSEGPVFRVDLRLRPEGDQGDLTISLSAALDYYAHRARDWELQMLIKARHSAGDARLTRAFLRGIEPDIYGSPADFEAVESVLDSRERISRRLREGRSGTLDVKRHPGGIRDIEFLTQCLQRLHGTREPWVRSGGTLHALRKLNDKGLISDRDYAVLTSAYEFLRKVEHRIQLERGQQTHRLPPEPSALDRLARRVGVEAAAELAAGPALVLRLNQVLTRVEKVYKRFIHSGVAGRGPAGFELTPALAGAETAARSYASLLHFLGAHAPELADAAVRKGDISPRAQPRVARFLTALLDLPDTLVLARERPAAFDEALNILRVSEYLSELLIRHPQDLAEFAPVVSLRTSTGDSPMRVEGLQPEEPSHALHRPAQSFSRVSNAGVSVQDKARLLRQAFRVRTLELGAHDCAETNIFDSLGDWSDLAATSAATALAIASEALRETAGGSDRGAPNLRLLSAAPAAAPAINPAGFAVLGLGRLGLSEFDLGSDADLVFVAASHATPEELASGIHLAERTIDVLSSYTRDGVVFAVDTRLRPRGTEGELVVTEDALLEYLGRSAQPWEALTYLKACPIAGDAQLGWRVTSRVAGGLFERFSSDRDLARALQEMRRRLEREPKGRLSPTKTAAGGYYDIDYVVSYLRLRHRVALPAGSNMPEQIAALEAVGILCKTDAEALAADAAFLRALDHAVRLVTGRITRALPGRPGQVEAVELLLRRWGLITGDGRIDPVQDQLIRIQQQVREIYNRLLGSE